MLPPYVAGPLRLDPFRGVMLEPRRVNDPASARLYARPYRAVAGRLTQWRDRGMLIKDLHPAIYLHEYTSGAITVRGLVGLLDVSQRAAKPEDGVVLPHEGIHPRQADELADRMMQMQMNPAPILLIHRAPEAVRNLMRETVAGRPNWQYDDRSGQGHRLWAIRDPDRIGALHQAWRESTVVIADGHHRYAAYLRMQARKPGGAADRGLAMIVDQTETPLQLGAIHRVLASVRLDDLRQAAQGVGASVAESDQAGALRAVGPGQLASTDGKRWICVQLETSPATSMVEQLHHKILPALPRGPHGVSHHHDIDSALGHLRKVKGTAVFLPAPGVDHVLEVAAEHRLLPEKATSFRPKPPSGVLLRVLADG
ncbi:DUF1015 domain-containing protein [soil metagenome]